MTAESRPPNLFARSMDDLLSERLDGIRLLASKPRAWLNTPRAVLHQAFWLHRLEARIAQVSA